MLCMYACMYDVSKKGTCLVCELGVRLRGGVERDEHLCYWEWGGILFVSIHIFGGYFVSFRFVSFCKRTYHDKMINEGW